MAPAYDGGGTPERPGPSVADDDDDDAGDDRERAEDEASVRTDERQALLPVGERALARRLGGLLLGSPEVLLGDDRDRVRELRGAHDGSVPAAHQQAQTQGVEGDDRD